MKQASAVNLGASGLSNCFSAAFLCKGLILFLSAFSWVAAAQTAPVNDLRANATVLPAALPFSVTGTNVNATLEPGEPVHDGETTSASVWWKWTPTTGGPVLITTVGSSIDTVLAVYTQGSGSSLVEVASDDEGANYASTSAVSFTATANVSYYIAVASFYNSQTGSIQLAAMANVAPPNDAFAAAQPIPEVPMLLEAPSTGLTVEANEPDTFGDGTIWWKLTAPQTGRFATDTNGAYVEAFTGTSLQSLTLISDANSAFNATQGQTVWLRATTDFWQSIVVVVAIRLAFPPVNDDFANATVLPAATPVQVTGTTKDSSVENDEPQPADGHYLFNSIWWKWTAPATGTQTVAASTGGNLEIFTGSTLLNLNSIAAFGSAGTFSATAGTTYYIRFDGFFSDGMQLSLAPPPANDNAAKAQLLQGSGVVTVSGTLIGATAEAQEPPRGGGQSVWYRWKATATGAVTVEASFDSTLQWALPVVGVFAGTYPSLESVASPGDDWRTSFAATAGVTYLIRVDTDGDRVFDPATFTLLVAPAPANDSFATATTIGAAGTFNGWNIGATAETGEPGPPASYVRSVGGNSVWWKWTATSSNLAIIDTYGSNFDTVLQVYTGTALTSLTLLRASDDARAQKDSRVAFVPQSGVTYRISVAGRTSDDEGTITLNFATQPTPTTADAYVAYGRSYMEGRTTADLISADQAFGQALSVDSTHPVANVLRAVTSLARLQTNEAFTSLLSQWGLQTIRTNLQASRYDTSHGSGGIRTAPAGADVSQMTQLANSALLPGLTNADANLAKVTSQSFVLSLTDSESAKRWDVVDYGDVQVLRAIANALIAAVHMNNSVNTDGSLGTLLNLENNHKLNAKEILAALPKVGRRRSGSDERGQFKTSVQTANTLYQAGSAFVRARTDTQNDGHHLFRVGSRVGKEQTLRQNAAALSQALDGTTTWAGRVVNLAPLMTTTTDYRSLMPSFYGNLAVVSTAPDATYAGGLVGGTQIISNKIFQDNHLLYSINSFTDWAAAFLGGQPAASQARGADPDHDGLSNLTEYVFALDPLHASSKDEYLVESVIKGTSPQTSHLAITFIRRTSPADITYRVDVSNDLKTWDTTGVQLQMVGSPTAQTDGITETVTYQLIAPISASSRKFLRVVAMPPP